MLARLARVTIRYRWPMIGLWLALTVFGVFASSQVSSRWFQATAAPGQPAYEASQRSLHALGFGDRSPTVVVFHTSGDATSSPSIDVAMQRAAAAVPGAFTSSFSTTGNLVYVSADRHTAFQEIYPPGRAGVDKLSDARNIQAAAAAGLPAGTTVNVTGRDALVEASKNGSSGGSSALLETLIGGIGALVVLLFVFGTLPAVLAPIGIAIAAILNTFTLVWGLTYLTDVSVIVQFLILLVGLGLAIDYALVMIFRFRDELRQGNDVETALAETMSHAGRSVIVSGSTVGIGLLSMVLLPVPLVRSIGLAGMLVPATAVLASLTLLPAVLAVLGERINKVRVMPKRLIDRGHGEDGAWGRWARLVLRRPAAVAGAGLVLVLTLAGIGTQLHASEAQLQYFPGTGTAVAGRQMLSDAHISAGVMKPLNVLVENGADPAPIAARLRAVPGVVGAAAPATWHRGSTSLVEGFPAIDGSAPGIQATVDRAQAALKGTDGTLTGITAVDRDIVHALFGSVPYVLTLVVLLTLVLLTRAFRSIVLAVKAVVLNLFSLAAAFGVVVVVFQQGHGSSLWGVAATGSITPYIPLMIFAFLYGLSMDYEVFMLSRMREAYDETGSTDRAIELGLGRTGKLVTSGALILMFAFLVLSTSPGYEVKPLAIGIAAGIIFDATVIRALLVPALMRLLGDANWWTPRWLDRLLPKVPASGPAVSNDDIDLRGQLVTQRTAPSPASLEV
jgi:RND superfamily putative drug exporter